jgi:putative cell wall-binding protein
MNKKRNLAVVMAAATVATSVAPVFAAEAKDLTQDELVKEVDRLLKTRYSDSTENGEESGKADEDYQNSVYKIQVIKADGKLSEPIKNTHDLQTGIENADLNDNDYVVQVTDKGHKEIDGKIVKSEKTKYDFVEKDDLVTYAKTDSITGVDEIKPLDINDDVITFDDSDVDEKLANMVALDLELKNGETLTIKPGDYKVNLTKPVDKDGNSISNDETNTTALKRIVGFEKEEAKEATTKDIPASVVAKYTVGSTVTINQKADKYYTSNGYTEDGEDLVNNLIDAKGTNGKNVVYEGTKYNVKLDGSDTDNIKVETVKEGGYKLTIKFASKEGTNKTKNIKLVLTSDNQKDLIKIADAITAGNKVTAGKVTYLSGSDRFDTAVEISKEAFDHFRDATGLKKAGAVVLVGENAIVDGLASAPLAKVANAPVLLTKSNEVPKMTMDEIERVVDEDADIYIIGGTSTVSKDVEKQLINKMNANVIRVSGSDRFATSAEIADELADLKVDKNVVTPASEPDAYVVGGNGLADAMSVASVAAQNNSPILVTEKDKLSSGVKDKLKDLKGTNGADVTIIGGTTQVSAQVLKDIKDDNKIGVNSINRISGATRAETNGAVIKDHFKEQSNQNKVFVAKDGYVGGDAQLIDALAVAPFAAREEAPVVLASDKLSNDQDKVVMKTLNDKTGSKKVYQAGQGVGSSVIKAILDYLDL